MSVGTLNTSIQGLNAAQAQLNVISQNVANATTPGYTRKTLSQSTVILNGISAGVHVGTISRATDPSLQYDLWQQSSTANAANTKQSYLNQIQQLFGTPDSNTSVAASLTKIKSDLIALSADPGNSVYQSQVVSDARNSTVQYNKLSNQIQQMRNNTQTDIANNVTQVNQLLVNIASSNLQIVKIKNSSGNPADVEDQRDQYIQQLTQFLNVAIYSNGDGSVSVQTQTGTLLADTQAQTLSFSAIPQTFNSFYPTSANGVMLNGNDITSQITSGTIGALFSLRDKTLPEAQAIVDESAYNLAVRTNAQGVKLFTDSAGNIPANAVANYLGFSAGIQVNTAVVSDPSLIQKGTGGSPANAGDNTNILKLIDYAFGDYADAANTAHAAFKNTSLGASAGITIDMPTGGNIISYTQNMITTLAQQYTQAESDSKYQTSYSQTLQKNFYDQTGVSIDNEMTRMITIQQSYSASARMITAVSDMFKQLLNAV